MHDTMHGKVYGGVERRQSVVHRPSSAASSTTRHADRRRWSGRCHHGKLKSNMVVQEARIWMAFMGMTGLCATAKNHDTTGEIPKPTHHPVGATAYAGSRFVVITYECQSGRYQPYLLPASFLFFLPLAKLSSRASFWFVAAFINCCRLCLPGAMLRTGLCAGAVF